MCHFERTTRSTRRVPAWFLVVGLLVSPALAAQSDQSCREAAQALSTAFATTAKAAMPAVVSITVEKTVDVASIIGSESQADPNSSSDSPFSDDFLRRFFGGRAPQMNVPRQFRQRGQGSGFIVSKDGYILTNNHVVGDVDRMTVELKDGRKFTNAKVIGADPDSEVALIKIEADNLPVLPLGDSDKMEIGDWVMAIGTPFGLTETVTVGIVSAVGRSDVHIAAYEDFIQTDAAINPGNSGGPLINLDGQAIGINTAIVSESGGYMGIGFAIPINMARTIEEQLRKTGRAVRGYLGLYGQDVTADMATLLKLPQAGGVVVAQVEPNSPAAQAGVRRGDVIVAMNGNKIESYDALRNQIAEMKPGAKVQLTTVRNGKTTELTATLLERPTEVARARKPAPAPQQESQQTLGVRVQNLTADLAQRFGYKPGEGVIVTEVTSTGPAADAGIRPGDLILSVNETPVQSVDGFAKVMSEARKDGKVLLLIKRDDVSQYVVVQLGQTP